MLKKPNFRFSIKNMRRAKMSRRGVSMRKIKEVMRLKNKGGLSQRSIASSCKLSPTTVGNILAKAKKKKINLPETGGNEEALLDCGFLDKNNRGNLLIEMKPFPGRSVEFTIEDNFTRLKQAWRKV
jgi:hypothetical protein